MNAYKAYANGALAGYNYGSEANPYDPESETDQYRAYSQGYDYGVFLYSQDQDSTGE